MMDYVEANMEQPLPLVELAQHVGLSLPRLKSKFKQEVGVAPGDYIARRRIQRAAQLLNETNDSVTEIAMRLGFSSSQYFATVFKRYTLHSPKSARAMKLNL
jgi:transcriptional regulator GlxA family with amidase domain